MASETRKLLTIGIPTYNRSCYLKECLDHICPQLTEEVQLIVRDNCSNNYDFFTFIKIYEKEYGVISVQNKINVGGDANVAKLFEYCETKWLWVIGDDDYILDGAVNKVLEMIKQNPDAIYVKFNSIFEGETVGIKGFANAMRPYSAFAYSFFTSECINNIEQTKDYIYWHYQSLSTRCPQIIRVMKYLVDHQEGKCVFYRDLLLEIHGSDLTWSRFDIVPYQSIIFDYFRKQRKILRNNVFKEIVGYCFVFIDSAEISWKDKWYYYRLYVNKFGLINILRFDFVQVVRIPLRLLLPKKLYKSVKRLSLNRVPTNH